MLILKNDVLFGMCRIRDYVAFRCWWLCRSGYCRSGLCRSGFCWGITVAFSFMICTWEERLVLSGAGSSFSGLCKTRLSMELWSDSSESLSSSGCCWGGRGLRSKKLSCCCEAGRLSAPSHKIAITFFKLSKIKYKLAKTKNFHNKLPTLKIANTNNSYP